MGQNDNVGVEIKIKPKDIKENTFMQRFKSEEQHFFCSY